MRGWIVAAVLLCSLPLQAQEAAPPAAAPDAAEAQRLAKEQRIQEYLRKKEERIAQREQQRAAKQQAQAAPSAAAAAEDAEKLGVAPETAGAAAAATPKGKSSGKAKPFKLPKEIADLQAEVRASAVGQDPTIQAYLQLIDRGEATPYQVAALGNFLADSGLSQPALGYYGYALSHVEDDPVLWINVGTLHRQLGEPSQAQSAFLEALSIDPNNAYAHYNLGVVLDLNGRYDDAIEEYKLALMLDPKLGDARYNPQAVNNPRLLAVKTILYRERAGSAGLALVDIPEGDLEPAEAPAAEDQP